MTQTVHYFGYGSLVNRNTRPAEEPWLATSVNDWQRAWSHRVERPEAAAVAQDAEVRGFVVLTVERDVCVPHGTRRIGLEALSFVAKLCRLRASGVSGRVWLGWGRAIYAVYPRLVGAHVG